ncbi:MAG: hypothetical protein R2729_13605 [Bryobacteraceae bacterium]
MHRLALIAFAAPAALLAQSTGGPRGAYHFAQIVLPGPDTTARNLGGSISFDDGGGVRIRARMAAGANAATDVAVDGEWRLSASGAAAIVTNPAHPDSTMEVRFGDGAQVLIASPDGGDGTGYEMFVAVRAPAGGRSNADLVGLYSGAYLSLAEGTPAGLATAFVDLTADGAGRFTQSALIGHAAAIDDVNRAESTASSTYSFRGDGAGVAQFAAPSDVLSGPRELLVSEGGDFLIAYSLDEDRRDILFAVRRDADAASFQFHGVFRIVELLAENGFVFHPEQARMGAAEGAVRTDSAGIALVAEKIRMDGRRTTLTTVNRYLIGAASWFGPEIDGTRHNFALSAGGDVFVGAQVAASGALTLEHGIFAGIRTVSPPVSSGPSIAALGIANVTTPGFPALSVAPGSLASISGTRLATDSATAPPGETATALAGVRVLLNGEALPLRMVSAGRIDVEIPAASAPGRAEIQVESAGTLSNSGEVEVQAASPTLAAAIADGRGGAVAAHADGALLSNDRPAVPGETVSLYLTGLGSQATEIQVLFAGVAGEVTYAGPAPGYPGIDQINVTLPPDLQARGSVAVALGTPGAFTDLADLPVAASN